MTVGQLVRLAMSALDRGVGVVWVEGEIAQMQRPASGHVYFQLRDRGAVIPAVMWRADAQRLKFRLDPGMTLRVRGRLGIYERDGRFQLYVDFAEPAGVGAAAVALQQLRERLAAEGLFAEARKRPLPHLPRRIGVVTSARGAAVRDIIQTVQRRFPRPILIADAAVQGIEAPRQLVFALRTIVRADVDVVIVGRGGGSATDLAAFNDERVVRAVASCPVPVISAVGHEIDLTLCDLAADRRASTPTAAAEMAVPVQAELAAALRKEERRLAREVAHAVERWRGELGRFERRLGARHPQAQLAAQRALLAGMERRLAARAPGPRLAAARAGFVRARTRLDAATAKRFERARAELGALAARLDAMSPLRVLERGYAVATRGEHVLVDGAEVAPGDEVAVRLARGGFRARVTETE
jgi:exodeoxyribonuclease VII large subunit